MADCSFILFNKSFLQLRLVGARGGRAFAQTCAPAAPFCQPRKRLFRSLRLPRRLSLKPSLCWTPGFPGCAAPNSTPAGAAPTQVPGAES